MKTKIVTVNDMMQHGYRYRLTEPAGRNFAPDFKPQLTPKAMLALGVFGGRYMTDCKKEFPKSWFVRAKFSPGHHDDSLNYFHRHASQPLKVWIQKGWINEEHDPRGWFQWYCRYYMGRRLPGVEGTSGEDDRQIRRWRAMTRHIAQIKNNCRPGDLTCRPGQRQALLHWAYDSRKF